MAQQQTYHFDVPAVLVWISHILIGLLLIYVAYLIIERKSINKWIGILLLVIGLIAAIYHAHIWYVERKS
jgi:uncharacterized membrane protein